MNKPMQIDTAPNMTVQRMPKRSARRPIAMPPTDEPNQASELASDGAERAPPRSAAMDLRPTAVIHSAPNESDRSATETEATIQEERVSMVEVVKGSSRRGFAVRTVARMERERNAGRLCNLAKPIPDYASLIRATKPVPPQASQIARCRARTRSRDRRPSRPQRHVRAGR